jgi:N-acetylated-alpha-linked acidic dipeptidase
VLLAGAQDLRPTGRCIVSVQAFTMRITIPQLLAACAVALLCVSAASATLTPLESTFLSTTSASGARSHLQFYTSIDHVAGTPGDFATAQYTQQVLQGYGLQADIISFRTLLNYPINRSLELISAPTYTASLEEDIYPQDPTSDNHWRNLTFHGYGASGDVTGELVYANYGSYEDFQLLQEAGIDFSGKIVLTRYGRVFRGLKVQNAEAFGAIGCLIYSDPADDGFVQGTVYPDGPWRPKSGVQRGSVQFLSRCSGDPGFIERDPTICGYPTSELIPNIPSLPLSWGDALPLLQQMGGMAAPSSAWVGGLNVSYSVGPGPATVHLTVHHEYGVQELWNVVATIPGSHPDPAIADQQVLLSNHRDAWVYGSTDPNSGTAALLEIARGLGALLAGGWQPQRTIKLLSWDGEEYGLLGSTNYVSQGQRAAECSCEEPLRFYATDSDCSPTTLCVFQPRPNRTRKTSSQTPSPFSTSMSR